MKIATAVATSLTWSDLLIVMTLGCPPVGYDFLRFEELFSAIWPSNVNRLGYSDFKALGDQAPTLKTCVGPGVVIFSWQESIALAKSDQKDDVIDATCPCSS